VDNLPVPHDQVVRLPDGRYSYSPQPLTPAQPAAPQVVHVHQAPPDRTVQRIALGSGIGAGTVAAGVYFGPLLVAAMTSMAIDLAVVAVIIVALVWGGTTVIRTLAGPHGEQAAKNVSKARRRG
jgi:uncharacterized membrane protein